MTRNYPIDLVLNNVSGQPYSFLPPLDPTLPQPKILTEPQTFNAQIGDSLVLPCKVEDLGPMILLWKKGTRVLTAGNMMVKRDDRVVLRGNDLAISNINVEDGGKYSCEIEADFEYPVVITHTLEVLGKEEEEEKVFQSVINVAGKNGF